MMIGTYVLSAGFYDAYYLRAQKVRTLIKRDFDPGLRRRDRRDPDAGDAVGGIRDRRDGRRRSGADVSQRRVHGDGGTSPGLPGGAAVPAGVDAKGLPLGLQVIGRPWDEETLFSLGEVVENRRRGGSRPRGGGETGGFQSHFLAFMAVVGAAVGELFWW